MTEGMALKVITCLACGRLSVSAEPVIAERAGNPFRNSPKVS